MGQFVQRDLGGDGGKKGGVPASSLTASTTTPSTATDAAASITTATTAVLNKILQVGGILFIVRGISKVTNRIKIDPYISEKVVLFL